MFGLLGLGIAAAAGIVGHMRTRSFVGRRLRFTSLVEKPYLGVAVGVTATVIARLRWWPCFPSWESARPSPSGRVSGPELRSAPGMRRDLCWKIDLVESALLS